MPIKNVFIVGNAPEYARMWKNNGYSVVNNIQNADIVQFIGGADVDPALYWERRHPATVVNSDADDRDSEAMGHAVALNLPMVGICRGGQFLNVMSGGRMWQNVDGHAVSNGHRLYDTLSESYIQVSSTHHQMMRPSEQGLVIATAQEATQLEAGPTQGYPTGFKEKPPEGLSDVEVVYYEHTNSLCFQPHPEHFGPDHECQQYYFDLINHFFN